MPSIRHPWHARLRKRLTDGPQRRPWRTSLRASAGADSGLRLVVFLAGLALIAAGATLWLFSTLLTAPLIFAGLWVLSWEFAWARRWLHQFTVWMRGLWWRVRQRPTRWAVLTTSGIASGAACYWALMLFGPI